MSTEIVLQLVCSSTRAVVDVASLTMPMYPARYTDNHLTTHTTWRGTMYPARYTDNHLTTHTTWRGTMYPARYTDNHLTTHTTWRGTMYPARYTDNHLTTRTAWNNVPCTLHGQPSHNRHGVEQCTLHVTRTTISQHARRGTMYPARYRDNHLTTDTAWNIVPCTLHGQPSHNTHGVEQCTLHVTRTTNSQHARRGTMYPARYTDNQLTTHTARRGTLANTTQPFTTYHLHTVTKMHLQVLWYTLHNVRP